MEYAVEDIKVSENLVQAEANASAWLPIDFMRVRKLIPKGRSVIITNAPLGISLQIACSNDAKIQTCIN